MGLGWNPCYTCPNRKDIFRLACRGCMWGRNMTITDVYRENLETKLKEEKKMTREEVLKNIEELKAFVEDLDNEIPEMKIETYSKETCMLVESHYGSFNSCYDFQFKTEDTKGCYMLKAFELAHLMYAREHVNLKAPYECTYQLYFDVNDLKYEVLSGDSFFMSDGILNSMNYWFFPDKDAAEKVCGYMNRYVADKVKEMY